ncbi:MAG: hypothetical protein H0V70_16000 [Ktedonobacteraceae bacterium]|nr:hypothetical protein [Ktedonobacteraceae bacterium]
MSTIQPSILREDHEDETRIVELSSSYDGTSGCYHWLTRKLAIFEQGELVLQWHNGINAPVEVRLTFAEVDAFIEQFNTYCEDYDHTLPEQDVFVTGVEVSTLSVSGFEALPDWGQATHEPCTCRTCTSQDLGFTFQPSHSGPSLLLVQTVQPSAGPVTHPCTGSCFICGAPCGKLENHHNYCACTEH